MGCARSWATRRHRLLRIIGIGRRAVRNADWRILVAVAELQPGGAEHAAYALHQRVADSPAQFVTGRADVLDGREFIAESFMLEIEVGGHADVSVSDRPPLGVIGRQQILAAPSFKHCRELPAKVDGVADAGIHPECAGRRQLMNGVAGEKNSALRIALGHHAAARPHAGAEPFHLERQAERAAQIALAVNRLGDKAGTGIEHHQPPHGARRIDHPNIRP
jgi:hypothetical protein